MDNLIRILKIFIIKELIRNKVAGFKVSVIVKGELTHMNFTRILPTV